MRRACVCVLFERRLKRGKERWKEGEGGNEWIGLRPSSNQCPSSHPHLTFQAILPTTKSEG